MYLAPSWNSLTVAIDQHRPDISANQSPVLRGTGNPLSTTSTM